MCTYLSSTLVATKFKVMHNFQDFLTIISPCILLTKKPKRITALSLCKNTVLSYYGFFENM